MKRLSLWVLLSVKKIDIKIYSALAMAMVAGFAINSGHEHYLFISIGGMVSAILIGNGLAFWKVEDSE